MKISRLLRCLVCLVLVCCLIVNVSPLRANAVTAASVVAVAVGAGLVVASLSPAIGVLAGKVADTFNDVVNRCSTYLEENGWVVDGKLGVNLVTDEEGVTRAYVSRGLIEAMRSWFWVDGGVLTATEEYAFSYSDSEAIMEKYQEAMAAPFHCVAYGTTSHYWTFFWSDSPIAYTPHDSGGYWVRMTDSSGYMFQVKTASGGQLSYMGSGSGSGPYINITETGLTSDISTSLDLTLGDIASPDVSLEEGYATWSTGAVSVPNVDTGEDEVYYPVSIPDVYESTGSLTQSGAQAGSISQELVDSLTGASGGTEEDPDLIGSLTVSATLWSTFTSWLTDHKTAIIDTIKAIPDAFTAWFDDLIEAVKAIPSAFSTWLERLLAGVESIIDGIGAIPATIAEYIAGVLADAFAISDTYIQTKVQELLLKYPYLDTYIALGGDLKSFFFSLGTQPPIIYIDLGAGSLYGPIGGRTVFIDLTWYAEYKNTVDGILGAFLWLWFVWRFILIIPGLIQGQSGVWREPDGVSDLSFHVPHFQTGHNWLNSPGFYHGHGTGKNSNKGD